MTAEVSCEFEVYESTPGKTSIANIDNRDMCPTLSYHPHNAQYVYYERQSVCGCGKFEFASVCTRHLTTDLFTFV